jgi:hypothetical protein
MKHYVAMLVHDPESQVVVLWRRNSPDANAGRFGLAGALVADPEHADLQIEASSYFHAQSGVLIEPERWHKLAVVQDGESITSVFLAQHTAPHCRNKGGEGPVYLPVTAAFQREPLCPNVAVILVLALSTKLASPAQLEVK